MLPSLHGVKMIKYWIGNHRNLSKELTITLLQEEAPDYGQPVTKAIHSTLLSTSKHNEILLFEDIGQSNLKCNIILAKLPFHSNIYINLVISLIEKYQYYTSASKSTMQTNVHLKKIEHSKLSEHLKSYYNL